MAKQGSLKPISDEDYAKMMATYKKKSDQRSVDCNGILQSIVKKYAGKSIDVMSVGAGRGIIEDEIVRHPDLTVNSMHMVEPNSVFAEELEAKSAKWESTVSSIDVSCFDENYETSKRFDVIIMVHSIVFIENPVNAIKKLKSFLKDGAQIVIAIRGEKGGCELVSRMHEYMNMDGCTSSYGSNLNARSLANILRKHDIQCQIQEFIALHDFTDFIEKKKSPCINDVISILLFTKYDDLENDLKDELYKMVKERVAVSDDNKQIFGHSNCFITIENA